MNENTSFPMKEEPINYSDSIWKKEWFDMPEYKNKEMKPYLSIKIHFRKKEDCENFSKLIKQSITAKTKSMWYPQLVKGENSLLRYVDES